MDEDELAAAALADYQEEVVDCVEQITAILEDLMACVRQTTPQPPDEPQLA